MVSKTLDDRRLMCMRRKTIRELKPDLLFDANYGIGVADGAVVTNWVARVGGVTLTQATAGNKPTWWQNGIGTQPAVLFGGTHWMTLSGLPLVASLGTVVICFQQTDATGNQSLCSFYDNGVAGSTLAFQLSAGKPRLYHANTALVTGNGTAGTGKRVGTYTTNAAHDDWILYLDKTLQTLTPGGTGNSGDWIAEIADCSRMSVGCERAAGATGFIGRIAYIAAWDSLL